MDAALQGGCRYCGQVIDPNMQAHAIVNEVAAEHRVPVEDIYGHSRKAYIVDARGCSMRRIKAETSLPRGDIADLFGLDRSTLYHYLSENGNGRRAAAAAAGQSRQAQA